MKKFFIFFSYLFLNLFYGLQASETPLFYQININKEIGSTTWRYIKTGTHNAERLDADGIILQLNTYGGTVVHADSIRTTLLNSPIPVYAFINNNAASAGALIAIACDSIYMREGANIGAATVVNETGAAMPDKYQSYMRATMRSTAEAHGRDTIVSEKGDTVYRWRREPKIAEAMVDERIVIPLLSDSGQVLTFTANEALKNGYCEAIVNDIPEIIQSRLGQSDYEIVVFEPSFYDELVGFLANPALQALLITLIIGGIFMELKTPGIGLPSAVALIAAVLYFAPLYLDGLATNWEILLFIVGVILLILEFFVIPGFGIAGISGGILVLLSLILALLGNVDFDFAPVQETEVSRSILTVLSGCILGTIALIWILRHVGSRGPLYRLALHSSQTIEEGFVGVPVELSEKVGLTGIAATVLRPSGRITIGDDDFDAVSLYGFIDAGTPVRVVKYENSQLYVVEDKK